MSDLYTRFIETGGVATTDSRRVAAGAIFFALRGDNFDGNRYALAALEAGAAFAVVDDPELRGVDRRFFVVDDVLEALQELAREHRRALDIPIFALTGSNGKTTTKELTRAALSPKFTHIGCTEGNFNNHIGVPLTILSFSKLTQIGIVEMGANHCGEIAELCAIAEPNVGLITNIGRAHLEGFGGVDGVRRGKGEMFDYLQSTGGIALYNADDVSLISLVDDHLTLRAIPYGGAAGVGVELSLFGAYNQLNAAAAAAVANYFGVEPAAAAAAIAAYVPANNRSQIIERTSRSNRVVADCYNANPSSMEAAVNEFLADNVERKVLIVGAMRELGNYTEVEHRNLYHKTEKSHRCYFVGTEFEGIVPAEQLFATVEELAQELTINEICDSEILVKGSRSVGLEKLLDIL